MNRGGPRRRGWPAGVPIHCLHAAWKRILEGAPGAAHLRRPGLPSGEDGCGQRPRFSCCRHKSKVVNTEVKKCTIFQDVRAKHGQEKIWYAGWVAQITGMKKPGSMALARLPGFIH